MWRKRLWVFCAVSALLLLCRPAGDGRGVPADGAAALPAETKYIALTFDDGPLRSTTTRLLDGLRERGASATFFLVGDRIEVNRDLVERMKAEGHQVGNHTWSHVKLQGGAAEVVAREIRQTNELLSSVLGEGEYWLRPPYGLLNEEQKSQIPVPMVHWSIDPKDWEKLNTPRVVQAVLSHAAPNGIILMHDIYPTSVDAALQIVDALQAEGYLFVTVEELLALNGVTPQAGVLYSSGDPPA